MGFWVWVKRRLARIAPVRNGPVDLGRSCVGPRFDAAVPFSAKVLLTTFSRWSGREVVRDLDFPGRPIVLELTFLGVLGRTPASLDLGECCTMIFVRPNWSDLNRIYP